MENELVLGADQIEMLQTANSLLQANFESNCLLTGVILALILAVVWRVG